MTAAIKNPSEFPAGETNIILQGPVGKLETLTYTPAQTTKNIIGVICHPHPLFGGTMHNKVVYTIARAIKEMGLRTVRFNFRGVGSSDGKYAQGIGETDDLLAVLNWVKQVCPNDEIWLAGFSFGSYVAACAAKVWPTKQLISVAPPVQNFSFKELPPFNCPWLVIQGDQDEVVAPNAVFSWLDSLENPPTIVRMKDSGHFFHGKLIELREVLISQLSR